MKHLRILFLLLGVLFSQAVAKSRQQQVPALPQPLHHRRPPYHYSDPSDPDASHHLSARAASASCAQCTRKFCLDYGFPFCKKAEEKDVVTMCFQRDSRKDQIIVWGFIFGTLGLLGWAGVKRFTEMREVKKTAGAAGGIGIGVPGARHDRGNYVPVEVR
ncbi:uncharacterized protein PG986_011711 [Apiospora aurea]|uniref:MFS transporter n=1 Tax=Apiospora aurea TaxID=335848 RepID=A0ABR1PXW4_9PEZI